MPSCEISLLGTFRVRVGGRAVPDAAWRHRRAAQLVKILALADGHRVHRERLTEWLWPNLDADAAAANLRKAVHFGRRALGSEDSLRTTSEMVELWPGQPVSVDAVRFERAARNAADAVAKELFRAEFVASVRRSPEIASPVFDAHLCLAEFCLCGPAGHEEIVNYAHELLAVATDAGSVQGRALAELLLGEADLFSDRLTAAQERLASAAALHRQARAPAGQVLAMQRLAELLDARS